MLFGKGAVNRCEYFFVLNWFGWQEKQKINNTFSIKNQRKVRNDYVVQYKSKYLQLEEIQPTTIYKKDAVIIEEHLDESIHIHKNGKYLNFQELNQRPEKEIEIKLPVITIRKSQHISPANHPWRRMQINQKIKF